MKESPEGTQKNVLPEYWRNYNAKKTANEMIHHMTPFRSDKDLGRAYNEAFKLIGDDDWICLRDIDTLFLTHDAPNIIEEYVKMFPEAGILTCLTNRIGTKEQRTLGFCDPEPNLVKHLNTAEKFAKGKRTFFKTDNPISGFLMVISKRTWMQYKFQEGGKCLGIDTEYSRTILNEGLDIVIMEDVYVWHTYRLLQGISNKKHLV